MKEFFKDFWWLVLFAVVVPIICIVGLFAAFELTDRVAQVFAVFICGFGLMASGASIVSLIELVIGSKGE